MDQLDLRRLLAAQNGVVSRAQVLAAGGTEADLARLVRRRDLVRLHEGVFLDHTGQPTWVQQAWAAVLSCWPAALDGRSALRAHRLRGHDLPALPIEVAVAESRRVRAPAGVRMRRLTAFGSLAQLHLSPPRVRLDTAAVPSAARATGEDAAVAFLADACQAGRTTPERLALALRHQSRLPRRAFLLGLIEDVASGSYSALEHRYLVQVERAHGLPTASRQRRVSVGRAPYYRDVTYLGQGVEVELDGRLGHEWALDRWADLERDLALAVRGDLTLRVGWGPVLQPCRLATIVAGVLVARGWDGQPHPCRKCDIGGSHAPGAWDPPMSGSA